MTRPAAAMPAPAVTPATPPPRIKSLTLRHFKAISGELVLPFDGKNVALLGENGSGKTTLSRGLVAVMDASRRSTDQAACRELFERCQDVDASDTGGYVKLELEDGSIFTLHEDGRWDEPPGLLPVSLPEAAKAKRLLDYKALLRTYFLQGTPVDLFDLLLGEVLPDEQNPISGRSFGEDWARVTELEGQRRTPRVKRELEEAILVFNQGLEQKVAEIVAHVPPLLTEFDPGLVINLEFGRTVLTAGVKSVGKGYVRLAVNQSGRDIDKHTDYLNEARLSAIALCIHFAVLLTMPPTALKVLVLDDVLLGLDMGNRIPVLRLLETHFEKWQVLMLTYDPVWFSQIEVFLSKETWNYLSLRRMAHFHPASTVILEKLGILDDAQRQLNQGDISCAANTTRSAWEKMLKDYAHKRNVQIVYRRQEKGLKANMFWEKIKVLKKKTDPSSDLLTPQEIRRIENAQKNILNPASHNPAISLTTREVQEAIDAVRALAVAFGLTTP